jgi:hypothetical protein
MGRLCNRLMCLSKSVKVADNNKDTILLLNLSFSVYYKFVMFYNAGPRQISSCEPEPSHFSGVKIDQT